MTWPGVLALTIVLVPLGLAGLLELWVARSIRRYCARHGGSDVRIRRTKRHYVVHYMKGGYDVKARCRVGREPVWLENDPATL